VCLFSVALFGQGNFGRILGSVKDSTGAVLPGAQISIIDKDRGLARSLVTDEVGLYNAPTLIPGTYTVRVELPGFKTLARENVVVEVGQDIRVELTIEPGAIGETVTVNEAIPLVDTTGASLGGVLENAAINDMPLNGRNYQNLLNLLPGVMIQPGGSPWTQSSNNSRPDETNWMVDGVFNGNYVDRRPIANMPSPFTDGATILPIDAIQEFHLEENPKAEYGGLAGAVVNVGIRSGTNSYHGSAYAFGRSPAWTARNYFTPDLDLEAQLKQFGGVMGGPIMKDKLFFFGGYEGLRSLIGNPITILVPETAAQPTPDPAHSMVDAISALTARGITPSPVSLKLMGCTLAAPFTCTGGYIQGAHPNTTTFSLGAFPNNNGSDNGVGKIDYRINNQHSLNGMVFIGDYFAIGADHPITASYWQNGDPIRTYTVTSNWIWTASPRLLNDFRFGFNNLHFGLVPLDANLFANGKDYPLNTGITSTGGFPSVDITPTFGSGIFGSWRGRPTQFNNPVFNFQDNLSFLRGKHGFKFGGEFSHIHSDTNNHDTRGRIQFRGKQTFAGSTPLEDFFAGKPARAFQLVGPTLRQFTWISTAAFFQDDWRIAPKFMLNLGMRWSYVGPLKEDNGLLGGFDPVKGLIQQGQSGYDTIYPSDYKNFSPRVGFNWDLTGKGTTVLRGGSSVLYSFYSPAQFTGSSPQSFGGGAVTLIPTGACAAAVAPGTPCPSNFGGTISTGNAVIPGSFLDWNNVVFPKGAVFSCTTAAPCSVVTVDRNLKYPYIVNWNFGIQHAFTNNLSLDVSYVGNHGDRLSGRRDINMVDPVTGVRPYAAKFPYLAFIDQAQNFVRSNYNSLQATLTQRFSRGVSFKAGYTYGHGLDNGSLNRFALTPQDSRRPGLEYASSDSDVRHRLTVTGSYDIPGKNGFGQLLQGWKLNTILNIQTAQPWNMDDTGNDFSGTGELADRWNFYGNPKDFSSGASGIPYCDFSNGVSAVSCYRQSQISGIYTKLPASLAQQCLAVAPDMGTLHDGGCYVSGKSVMVPPKAGTFGTMGRNIFRDSGFKNVDFSVFKNFKFTERWNAQFRAEFFNLFNHPSIANPYGSANGNQTGWDPSSPGAFGSGGSTPDVAAGNPLVGSGGSRVMQLGLKLMF
jgi:hypothetical protein